MPRIPQYNRQQFASSYIGGPQADKSGEIIAEGVSQMVTPVIKDQASAMREREQAIIDQQANNSLIKYSIAAQDKIREMQTTYADNPEAIKDELPTALGKMLTSYGETIDDERVRMRFENAGGAFANRASLSSADWIYSKQEENALVATSNSLDTTLIQAGRAGTVEDLTGTIAGMKRTLDMSKTLVPAAKRKTLFDAYSKQAVVASLNYRVWNDADPLAVTRDIEAGKYDKIEYTGEDGALVTVPLDPAIKDKFLSEARTAANTRRLNKDYQILARATGEAQKLSVGVYNGDVSANEVADIRDRVYATQGVSEEEKGVVDAAYRVVLRAEQDMVIPDDLAKGEVIAEWNKLSDKIAAGGGADYNRADMLRDGLKLQKSIHDAVASGKIDRKFANSVTKRLMPQLTESILGQRSPGVFAKMIGAQDKFREQAHILNVKVDNKSSVPASEKTRMKATAMSAYYDRVSDAMDDGATITPKMYQDFANEAFLATMNKYYPESSAAMTDEAVNAVMSQSKSVTPVNPNPTDLRTGKSVGKQAKYNPGGIYMRYGAEYVANEDGTKLLRKK